MKARIKDLRGYDCLNNIGDVVPHKKEGVVNYLQLDFENYGKDWVCFSEGFEVIDEEEQKTYDFVNPSHYKKFEKETYQMMIDIWGEEAYIKHCEMCAFKYKLRAGEKPDQPVDRDLEKANWYLEMANKLRNK